MKELNVPVKGIDFLRSILPTFLLRLQRIIHIAFLHAAWTILTVIRDKICSQCWIYLICILSLWCYPHSSWLDKIDLPLSTRTRQSWGDIGLCRSTYWTTAPETSANGTPTEMSEPGIGLRLRNLRLRKLRPYNSLRTMQWIEEYRLPICF